MFSMYYLEPGILTQFLSNFSSHTSTLLKLLQQGNRWLRPQQNLFYLGHLKFSIILETIPLSRIWNSLLLSPYFSSFLVPSWSSVLVHPFIFVVPQLSFLCLFWFFFWLFYLSEVVTFCFMVLTISLLWEICESLSLFRLFYWALILGIQLSSGCFHLNFNKPITKLTFSQNLLLPQ